MLTTRVYYSYPDVTNTSINLLLSISSFWKIFVFNQSYFFYHLLWASNIFFYSSFWGFPLLLHFFYFSSFYLFSLFFILSIHISVWRSQLQARERKYDKRNATTRKYSRRKILEFYTKNEKRKKERKKEEKIFPFKKHNFSKLKKKIRKNIPSLKGMFLNIFNA